MDREKLAHSGIITFSAAALTVVIIPLYIHFLPPVMALWGIAWLLENDFRFTKEMFRNNHASVLFCLFLCLFLWQLFAIFWAESTSSGFERMFKRLSYILFPMVLFFPGDKIKRNINLLLRLFAVGTFIYLIFCFGNAFYESVSFHNGRLEFNTHPVIFEYENYFMGYRFAGSVHPSYLAMYVITTFIISTEAFTDRSLTITKRLGWLSIDVISVFSLYLLSSRAGFLAGIIVIPAFLLIKLKKRYSVPLLLTFITFVVVGLILFGRTNSRIKYSIESVRTENLKETLDKDVRLSIWHSAVSLIKENPVFGVGTGDASKKLKERFSELGYTDGLYQDLNSHNQFLEIQLENGLLGLFIFLTLLGYILFLAIKLRNPVYGLFLLMVTIFFVFETSLNRLAGISFFSLFSFLLLHLDCRNQYS